jgi:hypothetical protein
MLLMPKSGDNCNQLSEKCWQGGHVTMRASEQVHMSTCFDLPTRSVRRRLSARLPVAVGAHPVVEGIE